MPFFLQIERYGYQRRFDGDNPDVATSAHIPNSILQVTVELIGGMNEETCCRRRRHQSHPPILKKERDTKDWNQSFCRTMK